MVDTWAKKYSIEDKNLGYQFRIFSLLLLLIPTAVFLYIVTSLTSLSDLLQSRYLIPFIFSIIIILCVLARLQVIFSHLSTISSAMIKRPDQLPTELEGIQGTHELRGIADSFGALLEKCQKTSSDLQHRALELVLIKQLAEEASFNLDMNKLLNVLLDKVMQINRARIGSVFVVDEDGKNFHITCSRGSGKSTLTGDSISVKDSLVQHIMEGKTESILVDDIETDKRFGKKNDPKYSSPSFLSLPVRSGGTLIAVLNLANKMDGERFQQEDVDLATVMIQEVGFALENARIHSEIKRHAERLEQQTATLKEEICRRKLAEKELEHLAHRDTLTGLSNRYLFIDHLETAVAQARRNKTKLAVMFVDLDRFKHINDTLGHAAGDRVLCEVAKRMKDCLREVDLVARYGGDEFTILLMDVVGTEGIDHVAHKIIGALQQPVEFSEDAFGIGCSLGISVYPDDSADFEGLINNADAAMYIAKKNQQSCFQHYTPAMTETG